MSYVLIRALLEQALNAASSGVETAYENVPYSPKVGTPYQRATLLPAQTDNPTMGDGFKRERGVLQILLNYPLKAGPSAAATRAEVLRTAFKRGTTFTSGVVRVVIDSSPSIAPSLPGDAWYVLPVSVSYFADVQG